MGLIYSIRNILRYAQNRLYTNKTTLLYMLDQGISQDSEATIQKASEDNIHDVLDFQPIQMVTIFKKFLLIGDVGYLAYLHNKCVHRSWVKENEQDVYPIWAWKYKLKLNEVIIHFCETAPEARGNNIYSHVLFKIISDYSANKVLIAVDKTNISSIKGIEKVGFRLRESMNTLVVLGMRIKKINKVYDK